MGLELFGATCPNCKKKSVFSKIEPNSIGAFQFDACTACGLIEFETHDIRSREDTTRESRIETWLMILDHHHVTKVEDMPTDEPCSDAQTAFDYKDAGDYLKECIIPLSEINEAMSLALKKK